MRLLSRSLLAFALLASAPSFAHASSYFTTFTDRAKYLAQVSASGYSNGQAVIPASGDASSIGGVGVSTTGMLELSPFGGSPALFLYPTQDGNTVSFAPGAEVRGLGLTFVGADNPGTATLTVTFNDPSTAGFPFPAIEQAADDGTPSAGRTVQYTIGGSEASGFFGVVLRDVILTSSIAQVTLTSTAVPTVVTQLDVATAASTVPEPATYALMGTGLLGLAATSALRRRRAS